MRHCLWVLFVALLTQPVSAASSVQTDITRASLVSEYKTIAPGKPFRIGLLLESQEGWHSYWENPGDAGLPTTIRWTLPKNFQTGTIDWPAPQRIMEGPLSTFSYEGKVLLPVTITPPAHLSGESTFKAKAEWLVCRDICIPESAELDITLPVSDAPGTPDERFAAHDAQQPTSIASPGSYRFSDGTATLSIPWESTDSIIGVDFFPRQQGVVRHAPPLRFQQAGGYLEIAMTSEPMPSLVDIGGLLSVTTEGKTQYFNVTLSHPAPATAENPWLPLVLLSALLGGLILNLMPCVLPVLSLKALTIVNKANSDHLQARQHGLAYTAGILLSFGLVAGLLVGLRATGEAIGWGYQMQFPAFVGFIAYLLWFVGLNLSGVFELPVLLGNIVTDANHSVRGSFLTGMLATAVATPCTAPFMAGAVGAALTLPVWQAMLVFEMLGLGLALPFLLLSLFPALLRFVPKPGAWMNRLKHALAIPVYASVLWLLWVLQLQIGWVSVATVAACMAGIVLLLKLRRHNLGTTIMLLMVIASLFAISRQEPQPGIIPNGEVMGIQVLPYSKESLNALRNQGKPVFIDATAAWCITCQVNARIAIHTPRTLEAFRENHITLMVADWTLRNDEITEFLSTFGYKGVPLYVYYPPAGEPVVLPQLLTEDTVISAVSGSSPAER